MQRIFGRHFFFASPSKRSVPVDRRKGESQNKLSTAKLNQSGGSVNVPFCMAAGEDTTVINVMGP